jgi:hypothetical protein
VPNTFNYPFAGLDQESNLVRQARQTKINGTAYPDYAETAYINMTVLKWKGDEATTIAPAIREVVTTFTGTVGAADLSNQVPEINRVIYPPSDLNARNFVNGRAEFRLHSYLTITYRQNLYARVRFTFTGQTSAGIRGICLRPLPAQGQPNLVDSSTQNSITLKIPQYIDQRGFNYNPTTRNLSFNNPGADNSPDVIQWMGFDVVKDPKNAQIIFTGADKKSITAKELFSYVTKIVVAPEDADVTAKTDWDGKITTNSLKMQHFRQPTAQIMEYSKKMSSDSRKSTFSHELHHTFYLAALQKKAKHIFPQHIDNDFDKLVNKNYFDIFKYTEDSSDKGFKGEPSIPGINTYEHDDDQKRHFPKDVPLPANSDEIAFFDLGNISPKLDFYEKNAFINRVELVPPLTSNIITKNIFEIANNPNNTDNTCLIKSRFSMLNQDKKTVYFATKIGLKIRHIYEDAKEDLGRCKKVHLNFYVETLAHAPEYDADRFAVEQYEGQWKRLP